MATTTNYSWATPDDTDLVKDGAAAIRTLGSSADTTVKNLNPGTTAGDIDYYTSGTAKARIGIGTAGQVLAVNSGATAPEWKTIPGGGKVLQVVQGSYSTSTTITGTTMTDTGLSLAITPTAATSKILVMVNQQWTFERTSNEQGHSMRIMRDATEVYATASTSTAGYLYAQGATSIALGGFIALSYLDSPATTSAITYKTQGRLQVVGGSLYYQINSGVSTITLLEIGA
jgi:hypothetical protein